MSDKRLGELLVRQNVISLQQLRTAQEQQRQNGQALGYTLARLGYISDDRVTEFLSQQYRVPAINLSEFDIDKVNRISGMDITFVTSANTDKEAKSLLHELGIPFKKN